MWTKIIPNLPICSQTLSEIYQRVSICDQTIQYLPKFKHLWLNIILNLSKFKHLSSNIVQILPAYEHLWSEVIKNFSKFKHLRSNVIQNLPFCEHFWSKIMQNLIKLKYLRSKIIPNLHIYGRTLSEIYQCRCLVGCMAMHACQIGPTDTTPHCPRSPHLACVGTRTSLPSNLLSNPGSAAVVTRKHGLLWRSALSIPEAGLLDRARRRPTSGKSSMASSVDPLEKKRPASTPINYFRS